MYREPTTHRLLEGQAEPPLLAEELSVPSVSSGTSNSLGCFPVRVVFVGPRATVAGKTGPAGRVPVPCHPRGRRRQRLTEPTCLSRQTVVTDTNLYDALSVPDAESSTMRCRKKLYDALSVRTYLSFPP